MFLALSCLDPLPTLFIVSNFTSEEQTEHAFMGTGTYLEMYEGMVCSDGGTMSGDMMLSVKFQMRIRIRVGVRIMK